MACVTSDAAFAKARFDGVASDNVLQDMWEKWVLIASAASMTCLMRATVGDIVRSGGTDLANGMVDECVGIARHNGFAPRTMAIERGAPIEADHIVGDLLRRGAGGKKLSLLRVAYAHLKAYEARRARESRPAA